MRFRKSVKCRRCGLTTTYSNEVEFNLWQSRPGCPACTKQKDLEHECDQLQDAAPMSAADVDEWYRRETEALVSLLQSCVITMEEYESAMGDVRYGARVALGLESPEPLVADGL